MTASTPIPIKALFVAEANVAIPALPMSLSIEWTRRTPSVCSPFWVLGYPVSVTTDRAFLEQSHSLLQWRDRENHRLVILESDREPQWSSVLTHHLKQLLPTERLGVVNEKAAWIANHLFFASKHQNAYDRLLLAPACSQDDIGRRFRRWSMYIHPDRFPNGGSRTDLLIERIDLAFQELKKAYQAINSDHARAIHDYYWQRSFDYDTPNVSAAQKVSWLKSLSDDPQIQTELIRLQTHVERGRWLKAKQIVSALKNGELGNRPLRKHIQLIDEVYDFLDAQSGFTSLK